MGTYSKFDVWKESEIITMHFNDLLMQLRLRALAATGFIVTIAGFFAKSNNHGFDWILISLILFVVLLAWLATYVIDRFYYTKLLLGSVKAVLEIEKWDDKTTIPINISTTIEQELSLGESRESIPAVNWFYSITGCAIAVLLIFCLWKANFWQHLFYCDV